MIVVVPWTVVVPTFRIKRLARGAVGLGISVDGITVQRPRDGLVDAGDRLQMHWRDVVVIIVRQAAVAAVDIEFADFVGDAAGVVAGIEDRDAIRAHGDRAALKISR